MRPILSRRSALLNANLNTEAVDTGAIPKRITNEIPNGDGNVKKTEIGAATGANPVLFHRRQVCVLWVEPLWACRGPMLSAPGLAHRVGIICDELRGIQWV